MDAEHAARANSFGAVAADYDRQRPGYPDELYTDVLGLAPGADVLEAGAGTGRATLALAARGAHVVAVEPDAQMAAVLTDRVHSVGYEGRVEVLVRPFADLPVEPGSADAVVSAQAWHWVDPDRGAAAAARALRPGGVICLWWNLPAHLDGPVWGAIHAVYARLEPELDRSTRLHRADDTSPVVAGFGPLIRQEYRWEQRYSADEYAALVATHSDHLALPPDRRERLLTGVHAAIDDAGGTLDYAYRTILLHATLLPEAAG